MNRKCGKCAKTVYPTEELKCLDKSWHKGCFRCWECGMALNMRTYKGFNKLPYCEAHIPKPKATTVADTPEMARIAENTKLQSNVKYHADFEASKGKFTTVADDPETLRIRANTKIISNAAYHGESEKKADMDQRRHLTGENGGDPVSAQPTQRVGSIQEYDPVNDQYGSLGTRYAQQQPQQPQQPQQHHQKQQPYQQQQQHYQQQQQQHRPQQQQYQPPPQQQQYQQQQQQPQQPGYGGYHHQQQQPQQPQQQYGGYRAPEQQGGYRSQQVYRTDTQPSPPQQQQQQQPQTQTHGSLRSHQPAPAAAPVSHAPPASGRCYRAMYDYEANDHDEISFRDGDLMIACQPIDDGWMTGTCQRTGQRGMLPANYVDPVDL